MSERTHHDTTTGPGATLEERLQAVERAITETDRDLSGLADAADRADRIDRLENRCERLDARLEELEAGLEAVRGYVGAVRAVNREVERRADAALAATSSGDGSTPTDVPTTDPVPGPVPRERFDDDTPASVRPEGDETGDDEREDASSREGHSCPGAPAPPIETGQSSDLTGPPDPTEDERYRDLPDGQDEGAGSWARADPDRPWTALETDGAESDDSSPDDATSSGVEPGGDRTAPSGQRADRCAGRTESPVDMGWEPVEPTESESPVAAPALVLAASRDERRGETRRGGDGDGDRARRDDEGSSTDAGAGSVRGHVLTRHDEGPGSLHSDGGSGTRGRESRFEWPPGGGLDVDRAQPWSPPDLPPAGSGDDDRSLLERLREAL